jgi:hypothetical protein
LTYLGLFAGVNTCEIVWECRESLWKQLTTCLLTFISYSESWVTCRLSSSGDYSFELTRWVCNWLELVDEYRMLLEMDWEVWICHSFCESNLCAEALANLACEVGTNLIIYERCPLQIRSLYLSDYIGVSTPRLVRC